jgi:hypothetical protein
LKEAAKEDPLGCNIPEIIPSVEARVAFVFRAIIGKVDPKKAPLP